MVEDVTNVRVLYLGNLLHSFIFYGTGVSWIGSSDIYVLDLARRITERLYGYTRHLCMVRLKIYLPYAVIGLHRSGKGHSKSRF